MDRFLHFKVDKELHEKVRQTAFNKGESIGAYCRRAISAEISREEKRQERKGDK